MPSAQAFPTPVGVAQMHTSVAWVAAIAADALPQGRATRPFGGPGSGRSAIASRTPLRGIRPFNLNGRFTRWSVSAARFSSPPCGRLTVACAP